MIAGVVLVVKAAACVLLAPLVACIAVSVEVGKASWRFTKRVFARSGNIWIDSLLAVLLLAGCAV